MDTNLQTIIDQARACKNCEEFNIIYFKAFSQKSVQLIRDLLPIGIEIDAFTWRDIPKITNTIALAKDAPEFVNALLNELIFPESMEDLLIWSVNSNEEDIFSSCLYLITLRNDRHDEYLDFSMDFLIPHIEKSKNKDILLIWKTFLDEHSDEGFLSSEE